MGVCLFLNTMDKSGTNRQWSTHSSIELIAMNKIAQFEPLLQKERAHALTLNQRIYSHQAFQNHPPIDELMLWFFIMKPSQLSALCCDLH